MNIDDKASLTACTLCGSLEGVSVFEHARLRVIRAVSQAETSYPAFYRVVWREHVRELSDLSASDFALCMRAVVTVERVLREQLEPAPVKINIASLGNMVPHLHWHVIARYVWDAHWPKPVWAQAERAADERTLETLRLQLPSVDAAMREALAL